MQGKCLPPENQDDLEAIICSYLSYLRAMDTARCESEFLIRKGIDPERPPFWLESKADLRE